MTDNKPVGGRGKKAGYETKLVRVPIPVLEQVEKTIADFRSGDSEDNQMMNLDQALEAAKKIMKSKKSSSESLVKLLQVLYGAEISKDDLR